MEYVYELNSYVNIRLVILWKNGLKVMVKLVLGLEVMGLLCLLLRELLCLVSLDVINIL